MSHEAVITGIGLLGGLGANAAAHWQKLTRADTQPLVVSARYAPYVVHPLGPFDFAPQIPKKADLRQMETWQKIGVYAAGLALEDAGLAGRSDYLAAMHLIVAAGSGERDTATDIKVLDTIGPSPDDDIRANEILPSNLRPTLFLAQLSNLLAGNISIVHKVTGSSRTFMGEESAGYAAVEMAVRRIAAGQGSLFLVGGAYNAEREDVLLNFELGGMLLAGTYRPVWERACSGPAGFAPASVGSFLVIEQREHAERRGARLYARIKDVRTGRCNRSAGATAANARAQFEALVPALHKGPLAVLSGASGAAPATRDELDFLGQLGNLGYETAIRAYGSPLGHGLEAHFPLGIGLAGLALQQNQFYPPFGLSGNERAFDGPLRQVVVTGWGHWRGEATALLTAIED